MRTFSLLRAIWLIIALLVVILVLTFQLHVFDSDEDRVSDDDNDRFSNYIENHTGTDPLDGCADNPSDSAWPPDFDNDNVITESDLSQITNVLGEAGKLAPARRDLNSDAAITGADLSTVAGRIGKTCKP